MKIILFFMMIALGHAQIVEFWPCSETRSFRNPFGPGDLITIVIEKSDLRVVVGERSWSVPAFILKDYDVGLDSMQPEVKFYTKSIGGIYQIDFILRRTTDEEDAHQRPWLSLHVNKSEAYLTIWPTKVPGETLFYSLPSGEKLDKAPIWAEDRPPSVK